MKNSILIVDNQILFAEGLRSLLVSSGNYTVKGIASSGLECLGLIDKNKPDILIINSNIGEVSAMDILKIIRDHNMGIKVIFLSSEFDVNKAIQALDYGVDGYLLKDTTFNQLLVAIETVLDGAQFIQSSILNSVNVYLAQNDNCKKTTLTKRETEILKMIAAGYLNKEIGSELNISERTVKNHVSSLFKKIGVSDRTQAAVYAIKNNMVQI